MNKTVSIVILVIGVLCVVGAYFLSGKMIYKDIDREDCDQRFYDDVLQGAKQGDECPVWDLRSKVCRKGSIEGEVCVNKTGNLIPMSIASVGSVLAIAGIVLLIRCFQKQRPAVAAFRMCSM